MTNAEVLKTVLQQSAINCCCAPEDFLSAHNVVRTTHEREGLPAYHKQPQICDLVSYGSNLVACCIEELVAPVSAWVKSADTVHDCFETPMLYGLNQLLAPHDARHRFLRGHRQAVGVQLALLLPWRRAYLPV